MALGGKKCGWTLEELDGRLSNVWFCFDGFWDVQDRVRKQRNESEAYCSSFLPEAIDDLSILDSHGTSDMGGRSDGIVVATGGGVGGKSIRG